MVNIERITELNKELFQALQKLWEATEISNPARSDSFEAIEHSLANTGCLLIASQDGGLIGSAWLTHDFRRMYIHHMAVAPEQQNKGIGAKLLEEALAIAAQLGYQAKLEVHQDNQAGRHLYEKHGFSQLIAYLSYIKR